MLDKYYLNILKDLKENHSTDIKFTNDIKILIDHVQMIAYSKGFKDARNIINEIKIGEKTTHANFK